MVAGVDQVEAEPGALGHWAEERVIRQRAAGFVQCLDGLFEVSDGGSQSCASRRGQGTKRGDVGGDAALQEDHLSGEEATEGAQVNGRWFESYEADERQVDGAGQVLGDLGERPVGASRAALGVQAADFRWSLVKGPDLLSPHHVDTRPHAYPSNMFRLFLAMNDAG